MKVNPNSSPTLNIEKYFGNAKDKTLVFIETSHGINDQILLDKKQLEKLHQWIGHRLTELL